MLKSAKSELSEARHSPYVPAMPGCSKDANFISRGEAASRWGCRLVYAQFAAVDYLVQPLPSNWFEMTYDWQGEFVESSMSGVTANNLMKRSREFGTTYNMRPSPISHETKGIAAIINSYAYWKVPIKGEKRRSIKAILSELLEAAFFFFVLSVALAILLTIS